MWWTNVMIRSLFSTKCKFLCRPEHPTHLPRWQSSKLSDRIRNLFQFDMEDGNFWFTMTHALGHKKRPAVFGPKDVTPVSRRAFGAAGDAEIFTLAQLSEFFDYIFTALRQEKLYESFCENSSSPIQQFMDQNNKLIMLRERTTMWITWFPPTTSRIILWTLLGQLPTFWNSEEFGSFAFCSSNLSLIS